MSDVDGSIPCLLNSLERHVICVALRTLRHNLKGDVSIPIFNIIYDKADFDKVCRDLIERLK